jgi:hypothetical protein
VKPNIYDWNTGKLAGEIVRDTATLRDSNEKYVEDAKALGKAL